MADISKALDNLIDALAGEDVATGGSISHRIQQLADGITNGTITFDSEVTVPTKVSDLDNDRDYTTLAAVAGNAFDGIILKSTTSESTKTFTVTVNDSGTLTASENVSESNSEAI